MKLRWALVTGATAGIGYAIAENLAKRSINLYITGRRKDRLDKMREHFQKEYGIVVQELNYDIQSFAESEKALSDIQELDILVNNAGLALGTEKFDEGHVNDWDQMIDTNVKGLLYTTRLLMPAIKNKKGYIINLGSVAGRYVYPGGAVYNASKFAVRAISEGLRMDLLGTGIRVTNIEPGMVETEFSVVRFKDDKEKADQVYQGLKPLTAEDIAQTVMWCIDQPKHVNIQELVIYPTDQASVYHVHRQ